MPLQVNAERAVAVPFAPGPISPLVHTEDPWGEESSAAAVREGVAGACASWSVRRVPWPAALQPLRRLPTQCVATPR
jgi:hypothetical protein